MSFSGSSDPLSDVGSNSNVSNWVQGEVGGSVISGMDNYLDLGDYGIIVTKEHPGDALPVLTSTSVTWPKGGQQVHNDSITAKFGIFTLNLTRVHDDVFLTFPSKKPTYVMCNTNASQTGRSYGFGCYVGRTMTWTQNESGGDASTTPSNRGPVVATSVIGDRKWDFRNYPNMNPPFILQLCASWDTANVYCKNITVYFA